LEEWLGIYRALKKFAKGILAKKKKENAWTRQDEMKFNDENCSVCGGSGLVKMGMYDASLGAFESKQLTICRKCKARPGDLK